jgi:acyl carrier protein
MNDRLPEHQLRELIQQVTGRDPAPLEPDDDLVAALGLDSLTALRLLAMVEKRFQVRIPDQKLTSMRTLRQIEELLRP